MKEKLRDNKRTILILALIAAVQLAVALFWACQKDYLFFDEVFSYPAANTLREEQLEFKGNAWMDENWFQDYMGASGEARFDYTIPYENQVTDVHPPLFYMLLHTACSMIPGRFSYLAGMSFNIILFLGSSLLLYFLGKAVFGRKECGMLAAFLYGISYGGLNTMVYIRMYMLMTFVALAHALVYLTDMEKEKIPKRGYVLLAVTLVAGVLSQYYFLFFAFFFGVWYTIRFLREKRYKTLWSYLGTVFASAAVSLILWPAMLHHLFGGVRGEEAQENFLSFSGYFADLKEMFRLISNEMFTNLLPVILGALGLLVLLVYWKERTVGKRLWKKMSPLLFAGTGYFLLVTKVAPYQVERYVMPLYPFVLLVVAAVAYLLLAKFMPQKLSAAVCVCGFGGLFLIHMLHSGIPYTYAKNESNIARHAITEQYHDNYAMYISDNGECHWFDPMQMLKEYKAFYHVYDLTTVEQTKNDMAVLEGETKLVVYLRRERTVEEANEFLGQVFPGQKLGEENLLNEDEEWDVYLLEF